jgi:uncharacterized protein YndB with AHSA1/START domain
MADIKHLLEINVTIDKVYKAITTQDGLANWWTQDVTAKPEVGSIAKFRFGDIFSADLKVTALDENSVIKWECVNSSEEEWVKTDFTFSLEESKSGTLLRFAHDNWWKGMTDAFQRSNFLWGYYLQSLKEYCELGRGRPYGKPSNI